MADAIRVLYVDDEPGLLEIARIFLEQTGEFTVTTSVSAHEALTSPALLSHDAIVSDYQMPKMDGIVFLKEVRQRFGDIPFILFTGRGREEVVIEAIDNGADFYLQKGGDPTAQFAELAHKIRQAVARRRAEHQRTESEKRFYDIIDFLPDATFGIDRSGTVMAWNRAMEEMTGVPAAAMMGKGDHEYAIPFYGKRRPILIDLVFSAPEGVQEKYSFVRRDRDILTAESTSATPHQKPCVLWGRAAPLVNSSGEVIGAIESIRDITESKEAEERLRISEARYRTVVNDQTEMIARFTRDGTVTFANEAYRSYFSPRLGRDDMVGMKIRTLMQIQDYNAVEQFLASLTPEEPMRTMERVVTGKDKKTYYQNWSVRALFDAEGNAAEYQVVGRDITDRKEAEETIARGREYMDQVFSSVKAGIVIIDAANHEIIDINTAGAAMIGLPKEQILGSICHTFICPTETGQCPITDLHKTVDNEERLLISGEGQKIPIIKYVTRTNLNGRECLLETFIDNRERREAEDKIRESEAKYRDLADLLPQMVVETDLNLKITYANRHALTVFSMTKEDLAQGSSVLSFIDPSQHNDVKESVRSMLENKPFEAREYTAIKKDKSTFPVLIYSSPLYRDTKLAGFRSVVIDISSRKKMEDGLRENEQKFRSIFESSPYPIAINSLPDNKFIEVNKAFLDVSGYTQEEILGKDPIELGLLTLPEVLKLISRRVLTGKIENVPLALAAKEGKRIHVLFSTLPVTIGNKAATLTVTAETTKLKRVEEDLLKKNEELNALNEELVSTGEELRQQYDDLSKKEEEVRSSEEKFRALVELSLDGIFITDFAGKIQFTNRAAGLIFDMPDYEAVIGRRNVMEFVAPESKADVARDFSTVAGGTDSYLSTYKLITEMKREIHVECIGKKILFANNPAILVSLRDITERKRAEEAVVESERKFATVFRKSPVAMTLVSAIDGIFTDVNDAFSQTTGYSRDEVVGRRAGDLSLFADSTEYEQFVSAMREKGSVRGMELKCREKSGTVGTCRFSSGVIMMGKKPHILSSVEDVTDRERAIEELRESEEQFRQIFESSPIAMALVTPDFRFYSVNPAFVVMAGYTEEELLQKTFKDITHPDYLAGDLDHLQDLAAGKIAVYSTEKQYIMKGNTLIRGLVRVTPLRDEKGTLRYFAAQIEDITERVRDEEALRQANKKLNLLSGITRHDIKNQLLVLDGYIALLHKKIPDPAYKDSFSRIKAVSRQIASLIQFTKEYEMVGVHAPAWQDIRTLADDAGKVIAREKIRLKNDLPAGTEVFADPLIAKVFFNLVDNAVRHGGKITRVGFSLEERDGDRVIICTDDGDGVSAEEKEMIFAMGYGKNTGFGLAISREILDITGITITETGEPGKGARFEIAVPKGQYRD